jgi:hypothetical protein
MPSPRILFVLVVLLTSVVFAQQSMPSVTVAPVAVDNDFIQKSFGSTCTLVSGPQVQTADLDGDGIDDAVIVARCTNPLMDQAEKDFKVVDPFNSFFGYGDPKLTTQFASEDPDRRGLALLIIHGSGADAWRAATPKAKFMIINLPFKQIAIKKLMYRKKPVMAIYADETGGAGTVSTTFWDGKKYKYQPLGSNME